MERPLDNFIKDKLSQQRFPIDDDAWESMETILDNKEVPSLNPKSKPFKLYKLAGLLCLFVLCYTIYMFSMKQRKAKQVSTNPTAVIVDNVKQESTISQEINAAEKERLQDANGLQATVENAVNTTGNQSQEIKNLEATNEQLRIAGQVESKAYAASRTTTNSIQINQESSTISQAIADAQVIIEAQSNTSSNRNANTLQINNANDVSVGTLENRRFSLPFMDVLQTSGSPYLVCNQQFSGMPHMVKLEKKTQIAPEKRRPLLGAYLGSQNYDTDRSYQTGLHGQFYINKKVSISLEPGYSYRALEAASVAKDSSEFVSFGANTYEQDIVGQSVHSLHIPAFIHYHLTDAFKIGGGVSYNRVLALGANKETRIDGIVTEEKEIWLDKEFYTNTFYRTHVYAGYMLNKHASLDVQYELPLQKTNLFNEETSIGLRLKLYL